MHFLWGWVGCIPGGSAINQGSESTDGGATSSERCHRGGKKWHGSSGHALWRPEVLIKTVFMYVFRSPSPYRINWSLWGFHLHLFSFRLLDILFGEPNIGNSQPTAAEIQAFRVLQQAFEVAIGPSSWLVDPVGGAENGSSWNTIFSSFPFFGESLYFLRSHVSFQGVYTIKVRFATLKKKVYF